MTNDIECQHEHAYVDRSNTIPFYLFCPDCLEVQEIFQCKCEKSFVSERDMVCIDCMDKITIREPSASRNDNDPKVANIT